MSPGFFYIYVTFGLCICVYVSYLSNRVFSLNNMHIFYIMNLF